MKEKLLKMLEKKQAQRTAILERSKTCEDVAELRSMNTEIEVLNVEIEELRAIIEKCEDSGTIPDERAAAFSSQAEQPESFTPLGGAQRTASGDNDSEYRNAWAKQLLGQTLTTQERSCYEKTNAEYRAFTHTTENSGILIPKTVTAGIWKKASESYGVFADVVPLHVTGIVTKKKSKTSSDAKWYDEATSTEDGKEEFEEITLSGCELARNISVSWMLKSMSVADFIPYIENKLAEKMGAALGYATTHGRGTPGSTETFKKEPKGIITALTAEAATPQIVTYVSLTYKDIISAISKLGSQYSANAKIYAENSTIWNDLAGIEDKQGRPLFVADTISGGIGRILGKTIVIDASLKSGEILIGSPREGYFANINQDISMHSQDQVKARSTDYMNYAIYDGNVLDNKAFVLLKK